LKPIIEVEHLSKQYRLGTRPRYLSLRDSLTDFGKNLFSKKQTSNPQSHNPQSPISQFPISPSHFWALDDVNFTVEAGESVGIIGRNGAGKSTLLKILSRITPPTKGRAILRGRLASLLEVGTGFHPELSGRENVFMNGSILGLKRAEIAAKFDEIVAFSGVEQFIDTPLKNYSRGMQLRLAFAVAAHLEPEILIIDEVLAVGDAEFQKKCLGKMDEVTRSGRTVLFVSHNLTAIQNLCKRSFLIQNGRLLQDASTSKIIQNYVLAMGNEHHAEFVRIDTPALLQKMFIKSARLKNDSGVVTSNFTYPDTIQVEINVHIYQKGHFYNVALELLNERQEVVFCTSYLDTNTELRRIENWEIGCHILRVNLPVNILRQGFYTIKMSATRPAIEAIDSCLSVLSFNFYQPQSPVLAINEGRLGAVLPILTWEKEKI
jgi:lipopolysaccharide transport system ATP-binding protein